MAFLETYGLIDLEGSITADLTWYGDQLAGTIKNTTSKTLKSPILAYGKLAYAFSRDLLPGDTLELRKDTAVFPSEKTRTAWGPLQEVLAREVIEKYKFTSEEEALAANTRSYLAHYQFFPVLSSRLFPPHAGEAWLLAFSDEPVAEVQLSAAPDVLTHSGCYMIRLPIHPAPGSHPVSAAETRLELLTQSPEGELAFVDEGYMEMYDSSCIVSATLPFDDPNLRVEGVAVAAGIEVGTNQDFSLEILDQSQPRWVEVPYQALAEGARQYGVSVRGDAQRYSAPVSGRVFLRMSSKRTPNPTMMIQRRSTILTLLEVSYIIGAP